MTPYRIGLVGLKFGLNHLRTLSQMERAEIVAVADHHQDALNTATRLSKATPYHDALEMLDQEDLDILVLSIPPSRRSELLAKAAELDLAVFVEKPWAANSLNAAELQAHCNRIQNKVTSGFSFRFLPAYRKLQSLSPTALGTPQMIQASYVWDFQGSPDGWLWDPKNGGGFFNENSCHLFDAINGILGRPVSLQAIGETQRGAPSPNAALVTIRYEENKIASLAIGAIGHSATPSFPQLELWASQGHAKLTGQHHIWTELTWSGGQDKNQQTFKTAPESLSRTRYTDSFEHFFQSLDRGETPDSSIADGIACVRMAEAIYQSLSTGETIQL